MRTVAAEHAPRPDHKAIAAKAAEINRIEDEERRTAELQKLLAQANPKGGDFGTPTHIGMRRHVPLDQIEGMEYEADDERG